MLFKKQSIDFCSLEMTFQYCSIFQLHSFSSRFLIILFIFVDLFYFDFFKNKIILPLQQINKISIEHYNLFQTKGEIQSSTLKMNSQPQYELDLFQYLIIILIFYFLAILLKYASFVLFNLTKNIFPDTDILKRYSQEDSECWAIVTGATDGIGFGFCQELIQKGFNLCLISRNTQKIQNVIKKLQNSKPTQFKHKQIKGITFDFTNVQDTNQFENLWKQIQKLDVGIFVNNVGIPSIKSFQQTEYKQIMDLINVNCVTMACLNNKLAGKMKTRKSKSAIINLSSFSGLNPIPYITLYTASKVFNRFISQGLSIQCQSLDVLSVTPMYVQSASSKVKRGLTVPSSRECAKATLKQLRFRQFTTYGSICHRIIGEGLLTFLPKWFLRIASKIQMEKLLKTLHSKKQ